MATSLSSFVSESRQRKRAHSFTTSDKLRFLLYPARLIQEKLDEIRQDDAGVIWLGKDYGRNRSRPCARLKPTSASIDTSTPGWIVRSIRS